MMIWRATCGAALLGLAVGVLGCGGPPVEDAVTVKFKVTQNGQPVSGPATDPFEGASPPPENPFYVLQFARLSGDQQLSYGGAAVLQGGVAQRDLPPGRYVVSVRQQKGMAQEESGQALASQQIEVKEDGQEFTIEIGDGGGGN